MKILKIIGLSIIYLIIYSTIFVLLSLVIPIGYTLVTDFLQNHGILTQILFKRAIETLYYAIFIAPAVIGYSFNHWLFDKMTKNNELDLIFRISGIALVAIHLVFLIINIILGGKWYTNIINIIVGAVLIYRSFQ